MVLLRNVIKIVTLIMLIATCRCGTGFADAKTASMLSILPLPDITVGGLPEKGFTCTGMAWDDNENCWWVGNAGKMVITDPIWYPTIVKLSPDFRIKLDEINLYKIFPSMNTASVGTIQGLCLDTSDNSFWFASTQEGKVRHVSKEGIDIGGFACKYANGIAYDSRSDSIWVLTRTSLINYSKTGAVLKSVTVSEADQDMLYLDEINNAMYFTAGAIYNGTNFVYCVSLDDGATAKVYDLKESHCVEGIYIKDGIMYIMNDGYYHNGSVPTNQVITYTFDSNK